VAEARDRSFVAAVSRGIDVMTVFEGADVWLGNAEIAAASGLAKTTVSRITSTLTQLGYLRYSRSRRQYRLGVAVLSLGFSALADLDVRRLARGPMQDLANTFSGAVGLFARDGYEVMQLESCHSVTSVLSLRLNEGQGVPLLDTAFGQALLWGLPEAERSSVLRQLESGAGPQPIGIRQMLGHAFSSLRSDGFCITYGRWQRDVNTIGVPLAPRGFGQPLALGFTCLVGRPGRTVLQARIAPRLVAAAAAISSDLARVAG
jgi:DNA-binding IclR family transcriptional regulator